MLLLFFVVVAVMCCDCDCYGFLVAVMRANLMAPFWNPLSIHRVAKAPLIVDRDEMTVGNSEG